MLRRIIKIDEEKCNGCGLCAKACHEGAIEIINGKAKLVRENFCDGLGDCLPNCPVGAITFEEREASAYDENAVKESKKSELRQWPCQIKLVPVKAEFFENSELLIAADCTAYTYANFHKSFMKGKTTIIGCPKLDNVDYAEKLTGILSNNNIKNVTLVRMEVPCCGGLKIALDNAIKNCGKDMELKVITISCDGRIIDSENEKYQNIEKI